MKTLELTVYKAVELKEVSGAGDPPTLVTGRSWDPRLSAGLMHQGGHLSS